MAVNVPARGRAAKSNETSRFEREKREAADDGWPVDEEDLQPRQVATTLSAENARTILSTNDSPDIDFDRSINPYRGCEHACIYCYARPSHAYLGLSPGLDFETKLFFKPNAAALLDKELRKPGYRCERVQLGANTDPYQHAEKSLAISRAVLEVLAAFRHPVGITTKSALVTRDIDILAPMARDNLAMVAISITTLDHRLARRMEPRAATPLLRMRAVKQLADAGIPVMVGVSPMIPGLTDHEMEEILELAAAAGATGAYWSTLRLPHELKDLFREWLAAEMPDRAARVMALVQQMRGGKDNDSTFGKRFSGEGPLAELMDRRFRLALRRLGLNGRLGGLDTTLFRVPPARGDQLQLF